MCGLLFKKYRKVDSYLSSLKIENRLTIIHYHILCVTGAVSRSTFTWLILKKRSIQYELINVIPILGLNIEHLFKLIHLWIFPNTYGKLYDLKNWNWKQKKIQIKFYVLSYSLITYCMDKCSIKWYLHLASLFSSQCTVEMNMKIATPNSFGTTKQKK